jgi:hypothetical protein
MRTLRWIIISVAVVVVLAVLAIAAGAVWLNTFIHSESFRHEIEARAGQSLGGTVQVQTVNFNIFEGVKLQGLVTQIDPSHVNGQGALLVKVESVSCTYTWKELLHRTLKLTGVALDKPQIVLTKQPTAPATPQARPGFADSGGAQGEGTAMPFKFVLDRAKISGGAFSVRDESGATTFDLQGIDADVNTAAYYAGKDVTGTLSVTDLILPSGLRAKNFSTPFSYRQGMIDARPFAASAFSGNVAGGYQLGATGPSILDLNAKGLDLAQVTDALNPGSSRKLSGLLDLQSKWRGAETGDLNGEGDAQVIKGKLEGVKILQDLSNILRVKELNAPDISKAQTHFLVGNQEVQFTGLQIESTAFKLTGDGVVGFSGNLNASMVLILSHDALGKMPKEVAASFVQQQDGTGSIAFHVTGTTSNPQTDLAARLLIQNTQLQNVITKQLNKFFNKKSQNQNQNQTQDVPLPQDPTPTNPPPGQ